MNKTTKPKDAVSAAFKASLDEAVKHARGRKARVKVEILNVRTTGEDVRRARQILNVSQPQFARLMVVSSETVKKWEQNKNPVPASVGYWVVGLKVRPGITKKLLFELAGRPGVRSGRAVLSVTPLVMWRPSQRASRLAPSVSILCSIRYCS